MQNELIKALANEQQKLRAIDSLTNCMQKLPAVSCKEVAYLIHRIIDSNEGITSNLAHDIQHWSIEANKDLFINITN